MIEGRFVYTIRNKPIAADHKRTGDYLDENRKLDARFCAKCFQEFVETNTSSPMVQLQIIRLCLAVIAYRRWDFRVMDISMALLRSAPLKWDTYAQLQKGVEGDKVAWGCRNRCAV